MGSEPSLTLIAGRRGDLFRRFQVPAAREVRGELAVNPLYRIGRSGGSSVLTLSFPTPEYEEEFRQCRRYLPDRVVVEADVTTPIGGEALGSISGELRDRRVLIDAPMGYCS